MKVQSTPSEEIDGLLSHSATQTGSVVLGNSTISNPPHFLKWWVLIYLTETLGNHDVGYETLCVTDVSR